MQIDEYTRLKGLLDKLMTENQRLIKENDELKEKVADQKKLIDCLQVQPVQRFMKVFDEWLRD